MQDRDYHALADSLLRRLEAQADAWLQEDVIDLDGQRSGGLLELSLPNGSKLVVNKQAPLQEVWLAARAGGYHFRWDGQAWRDTKTGQEFEAVFLLELSAQAGRPLTFTVS